MALAGFSRAVEFVHLDSLGPQLITALSEGSPSRRLRWIEQACGSREGSFENTDLSCDVLKLRWPLFLSSSTGSVENHPVLSFRGAQRRGIWFGVRRSRFLAGARNGRLEDFGGTQCRISAVGRLNLHWRDR
jgi:hypothetical protein